MNCNGFNVTRAMAQGMKDLSFKRHTVVNVASLWILVVSMVFKAPHSFGQKNMSFTTVTTSFSVIVSLDVEPDSFNIP